MKKLLFIVTFFITTISFAQQDTLYFDGGWQTCKKSQASFYRTAEKVLGGVYEIKDHFIGTNIIQMSAFSITIEPTNLIGKCTYYYSDGRKKSEGSYSDDVKTGIWVDWTIDGKDSTIHNFGLAERQKITFTPQEMTERKRVQDSITKYNAAQISALNEPLYDENNAGFAFTIRAKAATFFIIEDVFFLTYTLGTEFSYNNHALGLDYTWLGGGTKKIILMMKECIVSMS